MIITPTKWLSLGVYPIFRHTQLVKQWNGETKIETQRNSLETSEGLASTAFLPETAEVPSPDPDIEQPPETGQLQPPLSVRWASSSLRTWPLVIQEPVGQAPWLFVWKWEVWSFMIFPIERYWTCHFRGTPHFQTHPYIYIYIYI